MSEEKPSDLKVIFKEIVGWANALDMVFTEDSTMEDLHKVILAQREQLEHSHNIIKLLSPTFTHISTHARSLLIEYKQAYLK